MRHAIVRDAELLIYYSTGGRRLSAENGDNGCDVVKHLMTPLNSF